MGIVESPYDQGSEQFGVGCGPIIDTVHKDYKIIKITGIGTFSTTKKNNSVINSK